MTFKEGKLEVYFKGGVQKKDAKGNVINVVDKNVRVYGFLNLSKQLSLEFKNPLTMTISYDEETDEYELSIPDFKLGDYNKENLELSDTKIVFGRDENGRTYFYQKTPGKIGKKEYNVRIADIDDYLKDWVKKNT